jgi:hypothetical protein
VVRLTVDLDQGGGIVAFYPTCQPLLSLLNTYDTGRNCQQSYYSGPAQYLPAGTTQNPNWNPWPWNPVQGGDISALWALDGLRFLDAPEAIKDMAEHDAVKGPYSRRAFQQLRAGGSTFRPAAYTNPTGEKEES